MIFVNYKTYEEGSGQKAIALTKAANMPVDVPLASTYLPLTNRLEIPAAGFDFAGWGFLESVTRVFMTPPSAVTTSATHPVRRPSLHAQPFHVLGFLD